MNKQLVERFNLPFIFTDDDWTGEVWTADGWMADGRTDEVEEMLWANEEGAGIEPSPVLAAAEIDVEDKKGVDKNGGPLVWTVELGTKDKDAEEYETVLKLGLGVVTVW